MPSLPRQQGRPTGMTIRSPMAVPAGTAAPARLRPTLLPAHIFRTPLTPAASPRRHSRRGCCSPLRLSDKPRCTAICCGHLTGDAPAERGLVEKTPQIGRFLDQPPSNRAQRRRRAADGCAPSQLRGFVRQPPHDPAATAWSERCPCSRKRTAAQTGGRPARRQLRARGRRSACNSLLAIWPEKCAMVSNWLLRRTNLRSAGRRADGQTVRRHEARVAGGDAGEPGFPKPVVAGSNPVVRFKPGPANL
jgi:hypothetical protein